MGPTCSMSRALPLGMSLVAGMSRRTISPKSLSAIQAAQEAPTLPAPTTVILGRWDMGPPHKERDFWVRRASSLAKAPDDVYAGYLRSVFRRRNHLDSRLPLETGILGAQGFVGEDVEDAAAVAGLEPFLPDHLHPQEAGEHRNGDAAKGGLLGGDVQEGAVVFHQAVSPGDFLHAGEGVLGQVKFLQ